MAPPMPRLAGALAATCLVSRELLAGAARIRAGEAQGGALQTEKALEESPTRRLSDHVAAWDAYVEAAKQAAPYGLQPECVPTRVAATPAASYRGVIVLFHGFTACPQQWHNLAQVLSSDGYEVLLPLTPGHGNNVPPADKPTEGKCSWILPCDLPLDDPSSLPVTTQGYRDFVAVINGIVRQAPPGVHVVAGLSLGGALAAFAGQATGDDDKALYSRQLIMNPLLAASSRRDSLVLRFYNWLGFGRFSTRERWAGWGAGCRKERSLGRAGICTFQVKGAAAANDFGAETLEAMALPEGTEVSVIYDQKDPVTSNDACRKLVGRYEKDTGGPVHTCVLPFTMHSMLSMYDDAGSNKWWLPRLSCAVAKYLTQGAPLPQQDLRDATEGNVNVCDLGCDNTTCPEYRHARLGDVPALQCP